MLLWGILLGFLAFGDLPGASGLSGAAIIIAAKLYMLLRAHRLAIAATLRGAAGEWDHRLLWPLSRRISPAVTAKSNPPGGLPQIGRRIRAFRKLQRLRLLDFAERAGCSESLVSRIETGRVMPSLSTLPRLSQALGVNVAVLMENAQEQACTVYSPETRLQTAHSATAEGDGSTAESLVPYTAEGRLEALIVLLPGAGALCGPFSHEGKEVGLVLEGTLELIVNGEAHVIPAGSSFYFGSDLPHSYRAASTTPCRVVWVNTPPTF